MVTMQAAEARASGLNAVSLVRHKDVRPATPRSGEVGPLFTRLREATEECSLQLLLAPVGRF